MFVDGWVVAGSNHGPEVKLLSQLGCQGPVLPTRN